MSAALRRKAVVVIAAALPVVVLLRTAPRPQHLPSALAAPGATFWLTLCIGFVVSQGLRALRLQAEWRGRLPLPLAGCIRVSLLHAAALHLLPFRGGDLGYPWMLQRRWGIAAAAAAGSLAWMRLQDIVVLTWLASLGLLAALQWQQWLGEGAALAAALLCTLLFLAVTGGGARCAAVLGRWAEACSDFRSWPRVGQALGSALRALADGARRADTATWILAAGHWLVRLATAGALLAMLARVPALTAWCGALGGEWALVWPAQPTAGFGSYEIAVDAATMTTHGTAWRDALIPALAVHVVATAAAVAAGGLALMLDVAVALRPARHALQTPAD